MVDDQRMSLSVISSSSVLRSALLEGQHPYVISVYCSLVISLSSAKLELIKFLLITECGGWFKPHENE